MVMIVGHRGGRNLWPENSLSGFRKLAAMPVEGVEFDVHLTGGGELLVIHDPTLDRTTDLVQRLQAARQDLALAGAIEKLDKYHLLVLDDLSYVQKSQAETSVLFELIAARYERRSLLITANQPFSAWESVFPDKAMTVAAIDRLVHHAVIIEMNVESYRRRTALERKRGPGRPPSHATPKTVAD